MRHPAQIATMLAVYLMWICGTTYIAISCHIDREHHTHCCASCECHHEGCDKSHFEAPHACNHDHSNTIALYDTAKQSTLNIAPAELCIDAQLNNNLPIEEIASIRTPRHYERDIPIPPPPTLSRRGMRAPPVVA